MKQIPLTKGKFAVVDDEDYEELSRYKWFVDSIGYAGRNIRYPGMGRKTLRMHRFLMGLDFGDRRMVDHIDGDGLNNQRSNLRICNHSQNGRNQGRCASNTSGIKGVTRNKGKWVAQISLMGKQIYIGCFDTPEEAGAAYREAARKFHGEFARF